MGLSKFIIRGAREHNLQNLSLELPRNRLICFTGVSGSGKSSLAFDTLYAEGQRRYVESLSTYARQFLGQMPKPDVDSISGLCPAISISQKTGAVNPRSTVGTITEIYDYLRVLFARVGQGYCPQCGRPITAQNRDSILEQIASLPPGTNLLILAPLVRGQKGHYRDLFEDLRRQGFIRARVDGRVVSLEEELQLQKSSRHWIEVVIDRLRLSGNFRPRLAEAVELALRLGEGSLIAAVEQSNKPGLESSQSHANRELKTGRKRNTGRKGASLGPGSMFDLGKQLPSGTQNSFGSEPSGQPSAEVTSFAFRDIVFSAAYSCTHCQRSFEPPSPQLFSFNSPQGMCRTCEGLGQIYTFDPALLISNPSRSFQQGCIEPIGRWQELSRWQRHIYQGVAETLERKYGLEPGTILETAWEELDPKFQHALLWGTGDEHITFTWRAGPSGYKWGGTFEGVIPQLLAQYKSTSSRIHRRALEKYMRIMPCHRCGGQRLNEQARSVRLTSTAARFAAAPSKSLPELCAVSVAEAEEFLAHLQLDEIGQKIAEELLKEIRSRLRFLRNVGLEYLTLDRSAPTLAGGELQRIRLASQIGAGLVGVLYILDEPSIGLHARDNRRLLDTLAALRDQGNTVIVVEHDEETIRSADWIVDFGPGPGVRGGRIVAQGTLQDILREPESITGQYLSGRRAIAVPSERRPVPDPTWLLQAAHSPSQAPAPATSSSTSLTHPGLTQSGVAQPGVVQSGVVQSGVGQSGVGQSAPEKAPKPISVAGTGDSEHSQVVSFGQELSASKKPLGSKAVSGRSRSVRVTSPVESAGFSGWLIVRGATHNNLKNIDVPIPLGRFVCVTGVSGSGKSSLVSDILIEALHRDLNGGQGNPGAYRTIEGLQYLDKMIAIDQSPIGRTPRSNPATYIKLADDIRDLFAQLPEAKKRGFGPGRFSFNVRGGRCEACEGHGATKLEMDFLADLWVPCPVCEGRRFNRETLQVRFKGRSIADVFDMDVQEALDLFENQPKIQHKLQTLHDVGLDYLKLGQPSPTLSGGEAQRIKLARELVRPSTGKTLYILDEPTTGLHFADIQMLLKVLHGFVEAGNTVLVVEHNMEVIKTADWIIDLGPEGGQAGGRIVCMGTPEQVAQCPDSYTGQVLRGYLPAFRSPAFREQKGDGRIKIRTSGLQEFEKPVAAGFPEPGSGTAKGRRKTAAGNGQLKQAILVQGARQNNLKGIDVLVPHERITVCCGPSGSGKTSLAMETLYAEGQRRYVESLSPYARQFVSQMPKPKFEHIEGLLPAVAIEQKHLGHTPRSTVGTVTEIYDYLRVLMARLGQPYCPQCDLPVGAQTADQISQKIASLPAGSRVYLTAPVELEQGETYEQLWSRLRSEGYVRVRIDGVTYALDQIPDLERRRKHTIEVVIDRLTIRPDQQSRIAGSVENALAVGKGVLRVVHMAEGTPEPLWKIDVHSQHLACPQCGRSFEPLSPHHFSFNSPMGWCPACQGLGVQIGTDPAALIQDPKLSLAQGALLGWPGPNNPFFLPMIQAFGQGTGIATDQPVELLNARQRRLLLQGTGEQWFEVPAEAGAVGWAKRSPSAISAPLPTGGASWLFRFQYKGLARALEEATRIAPTFRSQLEHLVAEVECSVCAGSRLRDDAAAVRLQGRTIDEICRLPLGRLLEEIQQWRLTEREQKIAGQLLEEIRSRLEFLVDVGLEYLNLARPAAELSGGEAQRIRLAGQLGRALCGILYVLDEPTIGLHPRDNHRLLRALSKLRDLGNTLVVVEHDREVIRQADLLLDFGPGAGQYGGQIVAQGPPALVARRRSSVTGPYLSGRKSIPIPLNRRMPHQWSDGPMDGSATLLDQTKSSNAPWTQKEATLNQKEATSKQKEATSAPTGAASRKLARRQLHLSKSADEKAGQRENSGAPIGWLEIIGARHHNLKNITVRIPVGTLTVVTGPSGSGKSSLVEEILYRALARQLHHANTSPGAHEAIRGMEHINKVIWVDQQPIGQTPASNPATFTGLFDLIRELFAQLPEAKLRGYTPRRFSFNVPGGRCEKCEGMGQIKVEMHFLPDVWVTCDQCQGRRFNAETLAVRYHGKSIADVLEMSCGQAYKLFENLPKIRRILQTLCDVGLEYLALGQPANTLSGGESQRVKLAAELARPETGRTLYLLDEPTTGLHFEDIKKLLNVLQRLVDLGNTVVVIEHNLDVIKCADWIIDLGPEAGEEGGWVVVAGTPEDLAAYAQKHRVLSGQTNQTERGPGKAAKVDSNGTEMRRSYTAEYLEPVLRAGPYEIRPVYVPNAQPETRPQDKDPEDLGRHVRMPWEVDGRRWHCQDRVAHNGLPCQWDGRILSAVVDYIEKSRLFSPTNWNSRSVVEICGRRKSDGWFFHALTADQWLLKMKFRTAQRTFQREELIAQLDLKPLNEMPELPIYGTEPRVQCKNLTGPWQEVELQVHSWKEIDRPEFWQFLDRAMEGFRRVTERLEQNPKQLLPWKALGRAWHLARRGFGRAVAVQWEPALLEKILNLLAQAAPEAQFDWAHKQSVPVYVPGRKSPWAVLLTKKPEAVYLELIGPPGRFTLGQAASLASSAQMQAGRPDGDHLRLAFCSLADLDSEALFRFLQEHYQAVKAT
ncbi:MAG: excinuclease ABC subunit UvrA [Thermoguttaceae bacterium]|nr:excinuclease ABC subunit UvrA [Thermoguttaceae bacterium]